MDEDKARELISRFETNQLTDEDKKNWEIIRSCSPKERVYNGVFYESNDDEWEVEIFSDRTDFYTIIKNK